MVSSTTSDLSTQPSSETGDAASCAKAENLNKISDIMEYVTQSMHELLQKKLRESGLLSSDRMELALNCSSIAGPPVVLPGISLIPSESSLSCLVSMWADRFVKVNKYMSLKCLQRQIKMYPASGTHLSTKILMSLYLGHSSFTQGILILKRYLQYILYKMGRIGLSGWNLQLVEVRKGSMIGLNLKVSYNETGVTLPTHSSGEATVRNILGHFFKDIENTPFSGKPMPSSANSRSAQMLLFATIGKDVDKVFTTLTKACVCDIFFKP